MFQISQYLVSNGFTLKHINCSIYHLKHLMHLNRYNLCRFSLVFIEGKFGGCG